MSDKANLLRSGLLGFARKVWTVQVRDQTFGLKEPTGLAQQEYADIASGLAEKTGGRNAEAFRSMAWLLVRCLCEPESGEMLFTGGDDDVTTLLDKVPGDVVSELFGALMKRLQEQRATIGKGSEATTVSSSG